MCNTILHSVPSVEVSPCPVSFSFTKTIPMLSKVQDMNASKAFGLKATVFFSSYG